MSEVKRKFRVDVPATRMQGLTLFCGTTKAAEIAIVDCPALDTWLIRYIACTQAGFKPHLG